MNPTLELVGPASETAIGLALALYRKFEESGKDRDTSAYENSQMFFEMGRIKIITSFGRYAIFQRVASSDAFIYVAWLDDVSPLLPTPGGSQITLGTVYPVFFEQLMELFYDRLKLYDDGSFLDREVTFANAILATGGEYLKWWTVRLWPIDNDAWGIVGFQLLLADHSTDYTALNYAKIFILPEDATTVTETDIDAGKVIHITYRVVLPPIYTHTIRGADDEGDNDNRLVYYHDPTTFTGNFYEMTVSGGTLSFTPYGLPDLPSGSFTAGTIGTPEYKADWWYRLISSEKALNIYAAAVRTDLIHYSNYSPDPHTVRLQTTMDCNVKKYDRATKTLQATYNLVPTMVDQILQGVGYPNYGANCNDTLGRVAAGWADFICSRFVPVGGTVLVDDAGVEYPILLAIELTQDWMGGVYGGYGSESDRAYYLSGGTPRDSAYLSVLAQPIILWLGGTASTGMWTWTGVDAVGLPISSAVAGQTIDKQPGGMASWDTWIGDSKTLIAKLNPGMTNFTTADTDQQIIRVQIAEGIPVVTLLKRSPLTETIFLSEI